MLDNMQSVRRLDLWFLFHDFEFSSLVQSFFTGILRFRCILWLNINFWRGLCNLGTFVNCDTLLAWLTNWWCGWFIVFVVLTFYTDFSAFLPSKVMGHAIIPHLTGTQANHERVIAIAQLGPSEQKGGATIMLIWLYTDEWESVAKPLIDWLIWWIDWPLILFDYPMD